MRLPSSMLSCSHKKPDLGTSVEASLHADHDTQRKQIWGATQPHARSKLCWRRFCANFFEIILESPLLSFFFAGETIRNIFASASA